MRKQTTIFERMQGDKPDPKKVEELKKKIGSVVPDVVKAVRNRERLAASSRYRELEGVRNRKTESSTTPSSEDVRKQP